MPPSVRIRRAAASDVREAARSIRVGGQLVSPGEARIVSVLLPGRTDARGEAVPAWIAAGARPGPRVTVIGAPRGFEVGAARAATGLRSVIDPLTLHGGVVVVPVFRPGGHFAARGNAVKEAAAWRFPGDPGGIRRAREAFAVFSELVVGSSLVLVLSAADPGLGAALTVHGDLDDPRVRRLLSHTRAVAAVHAKPAPGSLAAAAGDLGTVVLELRGPTDARDGDDLLVASVLALLAAVGGGDPRATDIRPRPGPVLVARTTVVRAPVGGLLEAIAPPGGIVRQGSLLARVVAPLVSGAVDVAAPHDGVVLQATTRAGIRARAPLFVVGRVSRAAAARAGNGGGRDPNAPRNPVPVAVLLPSTGASGGVPTGATTGVSTRAAAHGSGTSPGVSAGALPPLHVGWVERVSLPSLGVERMRAKIDTGARTSALHVTRMTAVGGAVGAHRRHFLEVTLPTGSQRGAPPATVRVLVRDYLKVKDTSGRTERRPVIETTLRLGALERRIRVTLTNRGDMLFPLLIGRTALGAGVVVDPARRLLLSRERVRRRSAVGRLTAVAEKKTTPES